MNVICLRTFFITFVMFIGLCVIVIASLWWQNRKRFPEIGLWFIGFALQFVALWLITLRGIIPDFISIVAANVFIIGGTIILYDGLCRYVRCEIKLRHNFIMMDNSGNISYWNPAAECIFGYSATEAIGKNLHKLIAAEQFIPSYLEAFPRSQQGYG